MEVLNPRDEGVHRFEMLDTFNTENTVSGFIYKPHPPFSTEQMLRYGNLMITHVNGKIMEPQYIWATPKMGYPFDKEEKFNYVDGIDRIEVYEKLDGTNIMAYMYEDADGNKFVTYKTRKTPIVGHFGFVDFAKLWMEILEKYPKIPEFVIDNKCNMSFELFGWSNPILIKYPHRIDTKLLFGREYENGTIRPPSYFDTKQYNIQSAELFGSIDGKDNFIIQYRKMQEFLNKNLEVIEQEKGAPIVKGYEGAIWYSIVDDSVILYKCKPTYVQDIHWAGGIPSHSIYITCINAFEDMGNPTIEYIVELLEEEFDKITIQKKMNRIHKIFNDVHIRKNLKDDLIKEYNKHPEFDINTDKRTVMRHFSTLYSKPLMGKVYTLLWEAFGK